MYNRAKYHPNRSEDMEEAMIIFKKWLDNYKKVKTAQDKKYPFLSLEIIKKYEKLAEEYGVSKVARGIETSKKTDKGFLPVIKSIKGAYHKLQYILIKKDKPNGEDYYSYRINFIKSRIQQIKKLNTPFFYDSGKYKGLPTKQHIVLIMHGYSPYPKKL
jgi:hypothetical protein